MATIENYFVCVGAQKAGTTWLSKLLSAHPEIFVTPVKEIHYFDQAQGLSDKLSAYKRWSRFRKHTGRFLSGSQGAKQKRRDLRWYMNYLKGPINDDWYVKLFQESPDHRISGEFTPEYTLIGLDGYAHIRRLAPNAKVLFVLRKPSEQAWSQYLHFRDRRNNEIDAGEAIRFWQTDYSIKMRNYAFTLGQLYEVFDKSNVHVIFYEELIDDTSRSLHELYEFLDVSPFDLPTDLIKTVYNKSPKFDMVNELDAYLEAECLKITDDVLELVGRVPRAWTGQDSGTSIPAMQSENSDRNRA